LLSAVLRSLVVIAFCWWTTIAVLAGDAKRVLILNSAQPTLPGVVLGDNGIRQELDAHLPGGVEVFIEFLDAERLPDPERDDRMASFLREKYAKYPIDLLIVTAAPALKLVLQRRAWLFPNTPIIFSRIREESELLRKLPPGVTGITSRLNPVPTAELALSLQHDARHIVVVTGTSDIDQEWEQAARRALHAYENKLQVTYLAGLPMAELLRQLGQLPPNTAVLYFSVARDGAGENFVPRDVAQKVAEAANAPVYVVYDTFLGLGVVGGYMESFEAVGREVAQLALRVLAGERPETISARPSDSAANYVDWRQLRRWDLDKSRLPPGSAVRFKEQTLWERYRWQIVTVFALVVGQAILISALLWQSRRRRRAEQAAAHWRQELTHTTRVATLGALSGAVAHELNQPLTAILSNANAANIFLKRDKNKIAQVREILTDIGTEATRAGDIIRHLRGLFAKVEPENRELNLNQVIGEVLTLMHSDLVARKVNVSFRPSEYLPAVRGDRVQLEQMLLNLISNGCDAMISIEPSERVLKILTNLDSRTSVMISISDRGTGLKSDVLNRLFQPFVTTKERGLGLGLSISRSIIESHGGRLWASNNSNRGATFYVVLPASSGTDRPVETDPTVEAKAS
jgi:signal transduction histidine kinase